MKKQLGKDILIIEDELPLRNGDVSRHLTRSNPSYFLVKTDWSLEDVVIKIRERLAGKSTDLLPSSIKRSKG